MLFRLAGALTQVLWIGLLEKVVFGYVRLHVGRRCFPRRICGFPATMNAFNLSILEPLSASPGSPLLARKKTDSKLVPKPLIQWLNADLLCGLYGHMASVTLLEPPGGTDSEGGSSGPINSKRPGGEPSQCFFLICSPISSIVTSTIYEVVSTNGMILSFYRLNM